MARSYAIRTFGCQMNEHDSERIAGLLEESGLEPAAGINTADVIVLNTCCIRENADNKLYGALGNLKALKQRRPDLQIAVAGCLAQKDRDLIRQRASHVDVVFGTHNVHRAAALLEQASSHGPIVEILEATTRDNAESFPSALPVRRELAHAAWVTIQIGCDNSCAFCIVPAVRGPEISRPFAELLAEIEQLAAAGVSEITLLGQNVNSYGRDLALARRAVARQDPQRRPLQPGSTIPARVPATETTGNAAGDAARNAAGDAARNTAEDEWWCGPAWGGDRRARPLFADLLGAAGKVAGISRVRFTSPHPKDLRSETIAAMAQVPEVCEHLHLPLQSGSDSVLAAMRRGYTAQRYLDRLRKARSAIADLAVSTDIIVGFPGETEADFEQTLEVAAEARYDSAFTFIFSPRPGTAAAELGDSFVPHDVAVARYTRLRAVIERSSHLANQARIGLTEEVLVEGPSKKNPKLTTGRTRRNTLIHFSPDDSPAAPSVAGSYVRVRVTAAAVSHLRGELVEVLSPARNPSGIPVRRRTRIPVVAG